MQKVLVVLEDDLDGSEAVETVSFGLDGTAYEIDLNESHANALRKALAKYVEGARRVGKSGKSGKSTGQKRSGSKRNAEIRSWARSHGHEIGDRGRIPAEIAEAFQSAHAA